MKLQNEILIIENDEANAKMFKTALAMHYPPFESRIAKSLEEALIFLQANLKRYKLVVLDSGLEDAGGLEGLKEIKRLYPDLPVGMVTGNPDEAQRRRALRHEGAIFYVIKPPGNLHSTVLDAIDIYECHVKIWEKIAEDKVRAEVKAPIESPLLKKWQFWAGVASAVVGAVTTIATFGKQIGSFIVELWQKLIK